MKILHLIDIPWWSGLASYAMDCVNAQVSMGQQVFLLCEKKSLMEKRAAKQGIAHASIGGRQFWLAPGNFLKVGFYAVTLHPQWIIAHTGSTHWMAVFWGKILNIPVARTRAISQRVKSGFLSRLTYQNTACVIAASDHLKGDYLEALDIPWEGKLKSLPPPVENPSLLVSGPLEARSPNNGKIGVLARLDPKKGHFEILEAFRIIQSAFPDCELHIAGAEENLPWNELVLLAEKMGLKNYCYHGFLEYEQIWDFMKGCQVGLIASLESEEVSRALLEWMSAGRPVVASSVGCIPEILKDGEGGFLYGPGDFKAMAEKCVLLLKDFTLAQKMGQYNLERAAKHFSQAQFKSVWQGILYS